MADPLLIAIMNRLPPIRSEWPLSERLIWFRAIVAIFDLVYGRASGIELGIAERDAGGALLLPSPKPTEKGRCADCGAPRSYASAARCRPCYLRRAAEKRSRRPEPAGGQRQAVGGDSPECTLDYTAGQLATIRARLREGMAAAQRIAETRGYLPHPAVERASAQGEMDSRAPKVDTP